ncbi:hypothetical protein PIB30_055813 [Stylosanthes scabra]|uniref:CCHC-type domain-containing protein n=1 Tax=Stylosanthes scabra TaxID=79078 RepID=A0ABU6VL69_9FABA|nr:hypothetical protein [Stylosanthes scabra]
MDGSSCSNLSSKYRPELVKRMKNSKCYRCDKKGHWTWDCPLPPCHVNKPIFSSFSSSSSSYGDSQQSIFCRCGHGACLVSTHSCGKKFYACPITRGKACGGYQKRIEWCDNQIDESYKKPPPYKYPECDCGAGVCRKLMDSDIHKYYFACPIPRGHGACDYIVWEDELLGNKITVPSIQEICQSHDYDLGEGSGDLVLDDSKEMRVFQITIPEFEDTDEDDDLQEIVNSVQWDDVEKEALQSFRRSNTSEIGQEIFRNNSFSGRFSMGWLGYLIFLHPSRNLEIHTPQPFFCCISPSFDKIVIPKEAIIVDNSLKCNQLAITNFNEHVQLSSSRHETSRGFAGASLIVSSQGSERKPLSKAQRKNHMVLVAQQELLRDLESLDEHDPESMRVYAEDTFDLLDNLSVDCKDFSEHIWDFINNISASVDISKSMENCLAIDEEKERLARIKDECLAAEALFKESKKNEQLLREEVFGLEAMLQERRNKLKSHESESLEIEIRLGELKRELMEVETKLKGRVKEAELARRLNEERQTKKMAAMVALEKARQVLEN